MKRTILLAASLLLLASACTKSNRIVVHTDQPAQLNTFDDSLSWALGFSAAQSIASTGVQLNRELLFQAICNTLDTIEQPLSQEDTYRLLMELERRAYMQQLQDHQSRSAEVAQREAAYFADLQKKNPNVKKDASGIYYEVLEEGTGMKSEDGLVAEFDYKGSFTNGEIFDQTIGNREPIVCVICDDVFPGLHQGLLLMRGGSHYRLYIPSELGYGARGSEAIPPYSTLIYEIQLHNVHP